MDILQYGIALTGGIATGKSTVASLLKLLGYEVLDADKIAHMVLEQNAREVLDVFGDGIRNDDTSPNAPVIDRKKLGKIVFADYEQLCVLESLLHPDIIKQLHVQAIECEKKAVPFFIDAPIFFERRDLFCFLDKFVLVYASEDLQLQRLCERNSLSVKEAMQRIRVQIPIEEKREKSHDIINNTGDLQQLQNEIESYLQNIRVQYGL